MYKESEEYKNQQKYFQELTELKLSGLAIAHGDFFRINHDSSQLDGFFTADELRIIADEMDCFKKVIKNRKKPKFAVVYCSQCGQDFGPGNHGYSHCEDHQIKRGLK